MSNSVISDGTLAFQLGYKPADNPFPMDSPLREDWLQSREAAAETNRMRGRPDPPLVRRRITEIAVEVSLRTLLKSATKVGYQDWLEEMADTLAEEKEGVFDPITELMIDTLREAAQKIRRLQEL